MVPQIIYISLFLISLGITLAKQGELRKPRKYNTIEFLLIRSIGIAILYYGGFFDVLIE